MVMIPGPLCLNRLHKQIVSILLLFRNSQFSVSMCMSTHICENTCVYMCVNVHYMWMYIQMPDVDAGVSSVILYPLF